jgi:LysM repeat protein
LGRHRSKRTQFIISSRLPFAAAPALVGVAAAITLSASMTASPAFASTTTSHIASVGQSWRVANAQLLAAIHPIAPKTASAHETARRAATYTVRPGDTLSAIAGKVYHDPGAWPVLYWANRNQVRWANSIQVGEVLTVPATPRHLPTAPRQLGPTHAPVARPTTVIEQDAAQPVSSVTSAPAQTATTYTGDSSFQACVITRESGGNSQVMNSSGHYGLYQFSSSTWAEYGGNPADFGDASAAEQNRVFDHAIAAGGQYNWSPYDGC